MTERILTFNGYGGSNPRGDELASWVDRFNVDVALVSELGNLKDNLRTIGRVLYADGDTPTDVGIVVVNGKVDDFEAKKLTDFVKRPGDKPMLWRDRWYTRVRINDRVYYSIHGNAAIAGPEGKWLSNDGAQEWREGIKKLHARVKEDIEKGYAVRVGGDWNFPHSKDPQLHSPQWFYNSLGMDYIYDRVMWVGWDARYDKLVNKTITGIAPGADAHHNLLITLEEKKAPTPNVGDGGKQSYPIDIVTTPLGKLNGTQVKEELDATVKDYSPDLWAVQGAGKKLDVLRAINDYGVAVVRGERQDNPVLYKRSLFRLVSNSAIPVGDEVINISSFMHRPSSTEVHVVNTDLDYKDEAVKDHLKRFANTVKERSRNEAVVFWAGRFDFDADRSKIFRDAGLVSAHGELKSDEETKDFIGSQESDQRVTAKVATRFRVEGRTRQRARYSLSTLAKPPGKQDDSGTPTEVEEPGEKPARQKAQKDNGPTITHEDCCGGGSL